jgi:hypothetical protein
VTPQDLMATLYQCLGIDPHGLVYDLQNRPFALAEGTPIQAIL